MFFSVHRNTSENTIVLPLPITNIKHAERRGISFVLRYFLIAVYQFVCICAGYGQKLP